MMTNTNRRLLVKTWPDALPGPQNFELVEAAIPVPGDGQVLVKNLYLSIDPYYRHALGPRFVGTRFRHPGDVMMAVTLGEVLQSKDPAVPVGCHVTSLLGDMQDYAVIGGRDVRVLDDAIFGAGGLPLSTALGVAGNPGLTAYAGLLEHGKPRPGETLVVSSAGGCVGATVGQLAKMLGLRAVGIAGPVEKCRWAVEVAGFDACISYRSNDFAAELQAACPDGIDINFEHIGGAVLAAILPLMNKYGRVVLSGLIDQYNQAVSPPGPNWGIIVSKVLHVSGLRVFDYFNLMPHLERLLAPKIRDGSFHYAEDIRRGLAEAPASLARVLTGGNFGKSLIEL